MEVSEFEGKELYGKGGLESEGRVRVW